jgi:hypothetical protein
MPGPIVAIIWHQGKNYFETMMHYETEFYEGLEGPSVPLKTSVPERCQIEEKLCSEYLNP